MLVIFAGLFGAIVGSFLNVLIIRHGARTIGGRSSCLSCARDLVWYDNVPVVSWLVLRGRCRTCGSAISVQYIIVEVLTGILFAIIAYGLNPSVSDISLFNVLLYVAYGTMTALLVAIAVYDARHTIIPDAWVYAFSLLALLLALFTQTTATVLLLLSGPAAAAPLFALWLVSKGTWMGLGDAKLALGIGWFLGPVYGIVAIFYAFIIGALLSVCILMPLPRIRRALEKRGIVRLSRASTHLTMKSEVAFGPFLVAAFFLVWFSLLYSIPLPL